MQDWPDREHYTAEDLVQIIRILRDPETAVRGTRCRPTLPSGKTSWRRPVRRWRPLTPTMPDMLREELGDVLLQVAFHVVLEEERGRLNFEQVCREVCEKLVFRHPNIFCFLCGPECWYKQLGRAQKNKEKGRRTLADELDTVPATLPALMRAQKLQKRAAGHGVGSQTPRQAENALHAAEAAWDARTPENAPQAAGELLFAAVDALRQEGIDAEEALTFAAKRFAREAKHQSNG